MENDRRSFWLGRNSENARMHAEVSRTRQSREARNTFFDAAETVTQMIEFGCIPHVRNRPWFFPNIVEEQANETISQYTRERCLRETFFMNRGRRHVAQAALEQRMQELMTRRLTTSPDRLCGRKHDEETIRALRELQAVSSPQAMDERGSSTRVVRGGRYSPTGTPRRRTRRE